MKKLARPLLWTLFGIYCLILIYALFLSRPPRTYLTYSEYFEYYTNFIPFKTIFSYVKVIVRDIGYLCDGNEIFARGLKYYIANLAGNLVLFLPMGVCLPCLSSGLNRFWRTTLVIFGMIVLAELAQGALRLGSIDVDDLILNLVGAVIGYGMIHLPPIKKLLARAGVLRQVSQRQKTDEKESVLSPN